MKYSFRLFNPLSFILPIVFSAFLAAPITLEGQVDNTDNVLWSGFQLRKSYGEWSFQLQPIFRFNNDFESYANSSIDYSARKKLGKGWHAQFIGRTWFMPDRSDRQFLWFDFGHSSKLSSLSLSMSNRVRWHLALDVNDVFDADFLRYQIQFVPTNSWKVKPTFAFEPWLQFNGFNSIRRLRFEPGLRFTLSKTLGLTTVWRRQHDINREVQRRDNLWVAALVIKL